MTRPVAILVLISTLSEGCGSTRYVAYPLTQQTVAEIRHQQPNTTIAIEPLPRGVGALRTAGTPEPHATLLETKADTTIVKVSSTPAPLEVPNTDVRRLVVTNHALGGVYGAGVGALITAGLMALNGGQLAGRRQGALLARGQRRARGPLRGPPHAGAQHDAGRDRRRTHGVRRAIGASASQPAYSAFAQAAKRAMPSSIGTRGA